MLSWTLTIDLNKLTRLAHLQRENYCKSELPSQIRLFHNNAVLIFQSKLLKKAYFIFKMTSQAKCTVDTMSEAKNVPTLVFKTIISCFWVNAAIGIFIVNFTHCFIPWNLVPTPWPIIWTFSKIVRNSKGVGLKANIE